MLVVVTSWPIGAAIQVARGYTCSGSPREAEGEGAREAVGVQNLQLASSLGVEEVVLAGDLERLLGGGDARRDVEQAIHIDLVDGRGEDCPH